LTICGGDITASGSRGAGIGAGYGFNSDASVASLLIAGGNITAIGTNGAAIGSGFASAGSSTVSQLVITNGSFRVRTSSAYSGIGSGPFSSSQDTVTIVNGLFDCSALHSSSCFNSSSLTFQDGSTKAVTDYLTVGPSTRSTVRGSGSLHFEYLSASTPELMEGVPMLHLDSISLPYPTFYTLKIMEEVANGVGFERELLFDSSHSRGCAFTVGSVGNYNIFFSSSSPESSGRLGHDGIVSFFAASPSDNFFSNIHSVFQTPTRSRTNRQSSDATKSMTPTSTEPITPTSTESMARTSSELTTPVDSQGSGGSGVNPAVIVPIVVVILAILVLVVVWRRRRPKSLSDSEYRSVTESFFEVRIT
jgi:hypothetical protein